MAKDAKGHGSESRGGPSDHGKDLMSDSQLAQLKTAYAGIKTGDPSQPAYNKLAALLSASSQERLGQLSKAGIPFVSMLARNRLNLPTPMPAHQSGVEAVRDTPRAALAGHTPGLAWRDRQNSIQKRTLGSRAKPREIR